MIAKRIAKTSKAVMPSRRVRADEVIVEDVAAPIATTGARDATVGARIQQARLNADVTQQGLANVVGLGRSAVAQWERCDSYPSIQMMSTIARFLKTTPEWLAFGVNHAPIIREPDPETLGYSVTEEVRFGAGPDDKTKTQTWALPVNWLRSELGVSDPSRVLIYRSENAGNGIGYGERVVVDTTSKRPSPAGLFLIWDGMGVAVAHIDLIPSATARKLMANVTINSHTTEMEAERIAVVGRVRGRVASV